MSIEGDYFKYLISEFPSLSFEMIKVGVFENPQIRHFVNDEHLSKQWQLQKNAWWTLKTLWNTRAQNYTKLFPVTLVELQNAWLQHEHQNAYFINLSCWFPEKSSCSHEQGGRFYQDLKVMEARYPGRWMYICLTIVGALSYNVHRLNTQVKAISENFYLNICLPFGKKNFIICMNAI